MGRIPGQDPGTGMVKLRESVALKIRLRESGWAREEVVEVTGVIVMGARGGKATGGGLGGDGFPNLAAHRNLRGMVPDAGGRAEDAARLGVCVWRVRVARQ